VKYKDRQTMAVIKGVEANFEKLTSIDSILIGNGVFMLHDTIADYGVMGVELVSSLGCGVQFIDPLQVYVPKRDTPVDLVNPTSSFNMEYLYSPGVVFAMKQRKYDSQYILTSLSFARRLLDYPTQVSALELRLTSGANVNSVKDKIENIVGPNFTVANRYEQQEDVFHIMKIEKFISYLFLTFILMIACFNVIGSLSMLIIDKKDDVVTLRGLGANDKVISRIFLFEGRLISAIGAILGLLLGLTLCYLQQKYGLISLGNGSDNFVVKAYPVSVHAVDVVVVFITVVIVGFLSVWYPVRYLSKRLLNK
jgi:lipoprotein-releasing system permease protein